MPARAWAHQRSMFTKIAGFAVEMLQAYCGAYCFCQYVGSLARVGRELAVTLTCSCPPCMYACELGCQILPLKLGRLVAWHARHSTALCKPPLAQHQGRQR